MTILSSPQTKDPEFAKPINGFKAISPRQNLFFLSSFKLIQDSSL